VIHLLSAEAGFGRKKKGGWITMLCASARIWQKALRDWKMPKVKIGCPITLKSRMDI
jgi:hypothetical protein